MLSLILLLGLGTTITVAGDGSAQFVEIHAAIASATPGDTILVEPGSYQPFTVDKDLAILGRTGTQVKVLPGTCFVAPIANLTLAGLELPALWVQGVSGRLVVDACKIGYEDPTTGSYSGVVLQNAPNATISRATIDVSSHSGTGLNVVLSTVHVLDSVIRGGKGSSAVFGVGGAGGAAISALVSTVYVSGCDLKGGEEGIGWVDGPSGAGILAQSSEVVVRGSSFHTISRGEASIFGGQTFGPALLADGGSKIIWSGVTLTGNTTTLQTGQIIAAPVAEPYLVVQGSDLPTQTRRVKLFGPPAQNALLLASLVPAQLALPGFEGTLGVAPPLLAVVPMTTISSDVSINLPITLPASFAGIEGVAATFQALFPALPSTAAPGKAIVTDAVPLLIRFD